MSTSPTGPRRLLGNYQPMARKAQEKRNTAIETHLGDFNEQLGDKFDPQLTKRTESNRHALGRYLTHHALVPVAGPIAFLVQEFKREKRLNEINTAVSQKDADDPHPYAIVERQFFSKKEAQKYVAQAHANLEPIIRGWQQHLSTVDPTETVVCDKGFFEIPVHTKPKVVTLIKTNRPKDAVALFLDAKTYQPVETKKPSLLSRIANKLKPNKPEERQHLLDENQSALRPIRFEDVLVSEHDPEDLSGGSESSF